MAVSDIFAVPDVRAVAEVADRACVTSAILPKQTGVSQGGPFTAREFRRVGFRSVHGAMAKRLVAAAAAKGPA
jgi:hypothetical protein